MGNEISLTAADGHSLSAYRADAGSAARGAIVVVQEIFGVNDHIRAVCDSFAEAGFTALAPSLFDRAEPGVELGYDDEGRDRGRALRAQIDWEGPVRDLDAAIALLGTSMKVGVVGYCWGGSLAWLAATRLAAACAVGYYGGQIIQFVGETPRCPVMLHFGETDASIPAEDVEAIREAHPSLPIFLYPAGHGFNCEARASFHADSALLARSRTLEFLNENLA